MSQTAEWKERKEWRESEGMGEEWRMEWRWLLFGIFYFCFIIPSQNKFISKTKWRSLSHISMVYIDGFLGPSFVDEVRCRSRNYLITAIEWLNIIWICRADGRPMYYSSPFIFSSRLRQTVPVQYYIKLPYLLCFIHKTQILALGITLIKNALTLFHYLLKYSFLSIQANASITSLQ